MNGEMTLDEFMIQLDELREAAMSFNDHDLSYRLAQAAACARRRWFREGNHNSRDAYLDRLERERQERAS